MILIDIPVSDFFLFFTNSPQIQKVLFKQKEPPNETILETLFY